METRGIYFDGEAAAAHDVRVALSPDRLALEISGPTLGTPLRWPLGEVRAMGDANETGGLTLARRHDGGDESMLDTPRLALSDAVAIEWLRRTRPALFARETRRGTARRVALWSAGAVAAVSLMLFVILPGLAGTFARVIPPEREAVFGRSVVTQIERLLGADMPGELACDDGAGRAALDRVTARLVAGRDIGYDLSVRVLDHNMVNAFAAPGGQVVLIRGLIDTAETPEQVAAVLAHEIGHVVHRDPTRNALRTAGSVGLLGLLFGDFAGGAVMLALAERLVDASYSQDAEAEADSYAHAMLEAAEIAPSALGTMFEHFREIAGDTPGVMAHFVSHPRLADRIAAARAATPEGFAARPVLTPDEWQALRNICRGSAAREESG